MKEETSARTEQTNPQNNPRGRRHNESPMLSASELRQAVLRERDRADRTGTEFSLVLYEVCEEERKKELPPDFLRALRRRIRSLDQLGWFQEGTVGLLLPSTGYQGAQALAADFAASTPARKTCASCEVFTYPSRWYRGGIWRQEEGNGRPEASGPHRLAEMVEDLLARRVPAWKRAVDLGGAAAALLLASPLFLLISLYIKLVSPGPVLFRQTRIGHKGRPFTFLKFRTMRPDNDSSSHRDHLKSLIRSDAPMVKLDSADDPRIIPGAGILRRTCLDELPQLANVLRGDMSLVGPRPCLPYEVEEYRRWQTHRFDVPPGLTGLWQVSGKNKLSFQQMIRLDIAYALSLNLLQDLKILLLTGPAIFGFVLESVGRRLAGEKSA